MNRNDDSFYINNGMTVSLEGYMHQVNSLEEFVKRFPYDVIIWFGFMKHMSLDEVDDALREREFKTLVRER